MLNRLIWKIRATYDGGMLAGQGREGGSWNSGGITDFPGLSPIPSSPSCSPRPRKKESLGQLERKETFPGALGSEVMVGKAEPSQWKAFKTALGLQSYKYILAKI